VTQVQLTPAVERASRKAAAWFWSLLQDFVFLNSVPTMWRITPPGHPFLGVTASVDNAALGKRLTLLLPPGVDLPEEVG
jgi:hypothetical protein